MTGGVTPSQDVIDSLATNGTGLFVANEGVENWKKHRANIYLGPDRDSFVAPLRPVPGALLFSGKL